MQTAKTLIRLDGCPGWSESSLDAQVIFFGFVTLWLKYKCLWIFQDKLTFWTNVRSRSTINQHDWSWDKKKNKEKWQNQQNDLCTQRRLRSAWAFAQSDQSFRCPHDESRQQRLWLDWADAQADLSLCWAHSYFVGFVMRQLKWRYSGNPITSHV